ncbi:hypothetical protein [Palleronia pelagia]|uniref:Uncharacterized protein n=1 Tax=Palleronia pelagia TaxID=387096 RepID=A0A1H8JAV8_9RHOB|nr:hypothetical protein [Palleronia pelagia]SEN77565.1 hypothetical protein SAMN04488011_106132 [Palleronia pelagia]
MPLINFGPVRKFQSFGHVKSSMTHFILHRAHSALALIVIVFCVSGLIIGWAYGHDVLFRGATHYSAMVPTTQLSFLGLALSLPIATSDRAHLRTLAQRVCAAVIFLVALNVCVRLAASDAGNDGMLPFALAPTDHMSYLTAGLLILAALLIGDTAQAWPGRSLLDLSGALCGLTTVGSVAMAHSFDLRSPLSLEIADGMSVFTAVLFGIVFTAILLLQALEPSRDDDFFDDFSIS